MLKSLKLSGFLAVLVLPLFLGTQLFQTVSDGAEIFQEACAGCHTVGSGDLLGPDLKDVTKNREQQWLVDFISNPDKMFASGDTTAVALFKQYGNQAMPNLGLSQEQVTAVIAYLQAQAGESQGEELSPPVELPPGDADRGQALFMGDEHLQNDGPPCMGCHSFGKYGLLGGGVLGPDLTNSASLYKDASLAAALTNIPWPTMKPIYTRHPLTEGEQADLRAFLLATPSQHGEDREAWVLGISLAGFTGAVLIIGLLYHRRLRGVRRPLVDRIQSGVMKGKS